MRGLITYIQRMSIHDGPGLRSTVFLKGCNMRCKWCHNPETWSNIPQLQYLKDKCIHCQTCINKCKNNAITIKNDELDFDNAKCNQCGKCSDNCPNGAISLVGKYIDSEEVVKELMEDKIFYSNSKGGITVSGGEPSQQKEFAIDILKRCNDNKIHTAIETNLLMDKVTIEDFFPLVNLWICDLKILDSQKHKKWTGVNNEIILSNIKTLSDMGADLLIHTPVIPNVNDDAESIKSICSFLSQLTFPPKYELLPYHSLGIVKYGNLKMKNQFELNNFLDKKKLNELNKIVNSYNLNVIRDENIR